MIIMLYRWKIKSGKEDQFQKNWEIVTKMMKTKCGSYGSRLHIANNGDWLGYAQWPNMETRKTCDIKTPEYLNAKKLMGDAIEESYPETSMEVKLDLLEHQ